MSCWTMNNQSKYPVEIHWKDADQCYIASAPDLQGCIAHGYTREEALSELQIAIELWLEKAVEDGEHLPSPSRKVIIS